MTLEQFANNASSTLNGAINNSTTTIVVTSATPFPSVGNFRLLLGTNPATAEIVLVTSRSGNTLTVVRGQEGTTAQSWSDLTTVTHILTAAAVITLRDALQGKPLNSSLSTIDGPQDGYALTWLNTDGYWAARPGSQFTTGSATEIYTTKTVSLDASGTVASVHGDGTARLYINGPVLTSTKYSIGETVPTVQKFGYVSDALQSFTVPAGITSLRVKMWGPGGGTANWSASGGGGPGGYTAGTISVTPGEVLFLAVGSGGKKGTSNAPGGAGGWPGGGFGTAGDSSGGGGGGLTGIFNTSLSQANALMIAGGGGGATGFSNFGAGGGGGTTGGSGTGSSGQGGSQAGGGKDGSGNLTATATTIAAGSNGQALPQSTINVASTTGYPTTGTILVVTNLGTQTVTYTGTAVGQFTGCSGGTGNMTTGNAVTFVTGGTTISLASNSVSFASTTIASGSNGASLPQGTINVASTTGFATSGTFTVASNVNSISAGVLSTITYTGSNATQFTGCTGGSGTLNTGNPVAAPTTIFVTSLTAFPGTGTLLVTSSTGAQVVGYTGTVNVSTTIAAGSNGQSLPQATINVASTTGSLAASATNPQTILVTTSGGPQVVTYTGTTGTSYTGCSGGTGTMSTGGAVTQIGFTGCITTSGSGTMSTGGSVVLGSSGSALTGGVAFFSKSVQGSNDDGGGGSGYFGGGAGQGDGRAGGGGSGFLHATRVSNGVTTTGSNASSGNTTTLPPNTTDVDYPAGIGVGAATGSGSQTVGTDGGDGYISIRWGGITTIDGDSIDFFSGQSIGGGTDLNITLTPAATGVVTISSATDAVLSSGTSDFRINATVSGTSAQKFKTYASGAIVIGGADAQNDTSAEAQAGLTGPLINLSSSTGTISSTTNQATIFNQSGVLNLQGNTDVRFYTSSTLRGGFDSAGFLRAGPSATSTASGFGGSNNFPATTTDYLFVYNSSGSSWITTIAGSTTTRAACQALNTGAGASSTVGAAIFAGGTSHATTEYAGNGVLEQSGATTSGLIFTKMVGNGTGFASTGAIWQTGAWAIGRTATNSSSTLAQAGITGPMINIGAITSGTATTAANQALLYNSAGSARLQGNSEVRFEVGTNLAGYFDSNRVFRIGPSASTSASTFGGTNNIPVSTDNAYGYNASGDFTMRFATGTTTATSFIDTLNTAGGASSMVMMRLAAGGTASAVTAWQGNGILEQGGASTSCIVYTATNNTGGGRITTGRMFQSGAWCIGDATQNDTSAEAQAGLTGPLLNLTQITGGTLTTIANQSLLYNNAGTVTLQGNVGHTFIASTTTVASTSTSKFITNVGRRIATNVKTANYTVTTSDEVIIVGTLASSITITLPASPTAGDTYTIKDQGGGAAANNVIIAGNGNNIDGASSYTMNTNYESITVVFANSSWSII